MLKCFHYILISAVFRTERNIIAHSTIQASIIAARVLPEPEGSFAIICKPVILERKAA